MSTKNIKSTEKQIKYKGETNVVVRNVSGTSDKKCKCKSWLKHYTKFSDIIPSKCSAYRCTKYASVGAHVKATNIESEESWIVPLCYKCNLRKDDIKLVLASVLVNANKEHTCG